MNTSGRLRRTWRNARTTVRPSTLRYIGVRSRVLREIAAGVWYMNFVVQERVTMHASNRMISGLILVAVICGCAESTGTTNSKAGFSVAVPAGWQRQTHSPAGPGWGIGFWHRPV